MGWHVWLLLLLSSPLPFLWMWITTHLTERMSQLAQSHRRRRFVFHWIPKNMPLLEDPPVNVTQSINDSRHSLWIPTWNPHLQFRWTKHHKGFTLLKNLPCQQSYYKVLSFIVITKWMARVALSRRKCIAFRYFCVIRMQLSHCSCSIRDRLCTLYKLELANTYPTFSYLLRFAINTVSTQLSLCILLRNVHLVLIFVYICNTGRVIRFVMSSMLEWWKKKMSGSWRDGCY